MKKITKQQRFSKDTHCYRSNYSVKPVIMLLLYVYCALTFSSVIRSAKISLECEDGWTLITPSKRCYKYFEERHSWQVARSTCISYSAVLAEPVGYEVNTELGRLIKNVSSTPRNAWIGYNYINEQTNKSNMEIGYWSDWSQTSITVAFWDINQPSLDSGRCVDIIQTTKNQWKWRLSPCEDIKPFLCQRTACIKGTFNCRISGKHSACLDKTKVCNDFPDCQNRFDESNCPNKNRFFIREDAGEINFTNIIRPNNKTNYGSIYQWTIEGKIGTRLYLSLDSRRALNVLSVIQIWLGGPTIHKSYLYGTYAHPLNRVLDTISINNFAIITWAVYHNDHQKIPKITWSSDPKCYWEQSSNRSASHVVSIGNIDLGQEDTINNCLDACNSTCSIVTVDKIKKKCYFYELVPLTLTSSCCESYVKLCPTLHHGSHKLTVGQMFQDIHSAKYPLGYSKNDHHTWILTAPLWEIITLHFIDVDLDPHASIIIYNGKISANKVLARLVNGSDPITLFSLGNILTLHFHTGPQKVHHRGFLARYKSGCDLTVKSQYVHIQSPGYDISTPYPVRFNCTWTVHSVTEPRKLTMRFDPKFSLKKDKDYLQVYNGTKREENAQFSGQGITGNTTPASLYSLSGLFILRVMITAIRSNIGFRATIFSQNYCGPLPDLASGYWTSVSGYYSGDSATYKCVDNYMNTTANTIQCTYKGNWEQDPKCVVKQCPPLDNLTHGHWVKESGSNNYRAVCHHNTRQKGYPITICWNGIWQGKPTCEKLPCQDFFMPRNASGITPANVTYMMGDPVNITCAKGYRVKGRNPFLCGVDDTPVCEDIDECLENRTLCEQVCVNTPSSYECVCLPGYQRDADSSRSCVDVDECKINNGECSHNCTNQRGSYKCSCPKGWELFTANGQRNVTVLPGDTGLDPGDYYRFNHTCVKVICPPADIKNGFLLTDTSHFYFNDSVNILCQNGYYLSGNSSATCLEIGNWTSLPKCKRATCPPVISKLGVVNPSGRIDFGQSVSINCSNETIKHRKCVWNLHNKTFSTVGDSPQCEVINCNQPRKVPGTEPYQYGCTTSGCSFNFTCLPTFTLIGSGSGPKNQTVTCDSNGLWRFNDLACKGLTCKDPGTPTGGEQLGNSYEEGSLITFRCLRPGFVPSNQYPLKCVYNGSMNWNGTVPQCIDKEKPKILNCTSRLLNAERMEELTIPMPTAVDNSGEYIMVKVTPKKFRTDQLILTDMNVTYTAKDYANNTVKCSLQIKLKDFEKPKLTCPPIMEYLLFETMTLTKDNFTVNVSDNSGHVSLTYEPTTLKIGDRSNASYVVKVIAKDPSNNTATCYIQVKTKDAPNTECNKRRLLIPNSEISCDNGTANNSCNVSCAKGNLFYDKPSDNTRRIMCDSSKGWKTEGIYCVPQQKTAFQIAFIYKYETKNETCVQKSLDNQMTSMYKFLNSNFGKRYNLDVKATKPTMRNLQKVSTETSGEYVCATLRIELLSEKASADFMSNVANMTIIPIYGDIRADKFKIPCGALKDVTISRVGFVCESSGKSVIINNEAICVSCPPGTYDKGFNKCAPCPENFYNSEYNKTQCTACPPDTYANKKGSTSIHSCYSKCPPGFYSANGFIPCMPCAEQTYSYNTTLCKSCSPGKKTSGWGASSDSECKYECKPGSYSQTGFMPCKPCPLNTYAELSGSKMCDPCAETSFIKSNGSANRTDCKQNLVCTGNVCENGGICNAIHEDYYCDCLRGFKGKNCSETIDPCLSSPCFHNQTCSQINQTINYKCKCENGFSGSQCEKKNDSCKSNTVCQHGGVCKDQVGDYECLCPSWSGYTGNRCQTENFPCQRIKCQNNATCIPGGKIRAQCVCQPGFTGEFCEKNIDDCVHGPCMNGGTCVDKVDSFSCKCKTDFDGKYCESAKDPCNSSPCGKNQLCKWDYTNNTHYCICVNDFIPNPQDKSECIAKDLCWKTPCKNNGRCLSSPKPFNCSCLSGYSGSTCQRSECTNNGTCKRGEECRIEGGRSKCVCKTPLIGGVHCLEAINYCNDNHCNKEGTHKCISMTHDYKCNCSEGFSGRYCQVKPCKPRCNNGECVNQAGNWLCNCSSEWKGDNCSEPINKCDNNPCRNKAKCYGNSKEYFCMCPVGFRAKTCNETINICEQANPCVGKGSSCQNHVKHATCTCPKGQSGSGCQISSLCTPTTCKNGGTCEIKSDKTNCICPIGFGGESCNITIDPCNAIKACNKSDCERQGQRAFCKCDVKKMGPSCQQDVLYDVDLFFPRKKGLMQPTPIPMWSRLTRDFLTLSFWIKYYLPVQKGGLTTSLVLYGTEKSDRKSQIMELLSFKRNSLKIKFSGIDETFDSINLDDGKWHHVFVSWANYSLSLYLDSQLITNNEYGKNKILPKFGLLIPAGTIDESKYLVKPSQFVGRISRLILLNTTWTEEDVKNYWKNVTRLQEKVLVDFYRNVLTMTHIQLDFESEINQNMCELNTKCTNNNKSIFFPVVDMCPPDQMEVSAGWAKLDWVQPKFIHNSTTVSNYKPGESYFDWGTHTIVYSAFGEKNHTSAVCTFQLFSRRFNCNDTISSSYLNETERNCQEQNQSIICTPNCHGSNIMPAIPGPLVYSCGVSQMWGKEQTSRFTFATCATALIMSKVNFEIEMSIRFDGAQSDVCRGIQTFFHGILKTHNLCSNNCTECSLKSAQRARRKRSVSNVPVQLKVNVVNPKLADGTPTKEFLLAQILAYNKLKNKLLNATVLDGTVRIKTTCPTGQQMNGQNCVVVIPAPGTFANNATNQIEGCPKGTYQPKKGQSSCVQCPSKKTTMGELSVSENECKEICTVGHHFSSKDNKCLACEKGFYQGKSGSFSCDSCKGGKDTKEKGSTSIIKCVTPETTTVVIQLRTLPPNDPDAAAVTKAGLSPRDIAIIAVLTILALFFIMCILLFCCRAKIRKFCNCLKTNKVAAVPEQKDRYTKGNVKMVSYNLTNIRERRMGAGNDPKAYPQNDYPRNVYPENYNDNHSDVSSSLEGSMEDVLPLTKRRSNERRSIKQNQNSNTWLSNGDALLQMQQPRIGTESENRGFLVRPKPKRPKNNVVKVHLSNFPRKEPKIMIDSDEEDVR